MIITTGNAPKALAGERMPLTAAKRRSMQSSQFALPGKGEGPEGKGAGSYPIDTIGRARNALSRGAQNASSSELATIKRKVKAKFPSIKVGGKDNAMHNEGGPAYHSGDALAYPCPR
jgi:hypothetical protein